MRYGMRMPTWIGQASLALGLACLVFTVGCGPAAPPQATVKGKVTVDGAAVNGGTVTFAPIGGGGKPASGTVQQDGSFELATSSAADGAMIGQHQVSYSPPIIQWEPPEVDASGETPKAPEAPYQNLKVKEAEVEVKAGDNNIALELVPAT